MGQFTIVDSLDHETWDKFVFDHPKGSVFHTSSMVAVYWGARYHTPLVLAALDRTGQVLALLVSVLVQTLPNPLGLFSSRAILYAEPLCRQDSDGVEALTALLAEHDLEMRKRALFAEVRMLRKAGMEKLAFKSCGYEFQGHLNYLIDLSRPTEDIWQAMTRHCRDAVKSSRKKGVIVEGSTTEKGVDVLFSLLKIGYKRARIPLPDKSLFVSAYQNLQPRNMLKIFTAYFNEKPVCAYSILCFRGYIFGWYAGQERVRIIRPAEYSIWHQIEWAQHSHYQIFDFGGAGSPDRPYGVRDFKAKFGGELVNFGRYRKSYAPWRLSIAEKVYELSRIVSGITNSNSLRVPKQEISTLKYLARGRR